MVRYEFSVFADYFQIWLLDDASGGLDRLFLFSDKHLAERVWTDRGMIIMFTERNMPVPVVFEVRDTNPTEDTSNWDHIVEASIDIPSGRINIEGCGGCSIPPAESPVAVKPGIYRVRMFQSNLASLSEDGLEGDDHYRFVLWPDTEVRPVVVLKQWEPMQQ